MKIVYDNINYLSVILSNAKLIIMCLLLGVCKCILINLFCGNFRNLLISCTVW